MVRKVIDLSFPIYDQMPVFPGDPIVAIVPIKYTQEQGYRSSLFVGGLHSGTHIDSPYHHMGHSFDKTTIDRISLEKCVGEALVIDLPKAPLEEITADELEKYESEIKQVKRVLLNTGWHKRWESAEYLTKYPIFTLGAAEFLARQGIYLVGVDMPSVGNYANFAATMATHRAFLSNDIVLIENIANLSAIKKNRIFFVGAPVKIVGDTAPVRAFAIEE